jgi:hypothetical protein
VKTVDQLIADFEIRHRCELYLAIAMMAALVTFTLPMACALVHLPLDFELSWVIMTSGLKALLGLTALRLCAYPWL